MNRETSPLSPAQAIHALNAFTPAERARLVALRQRVHARRNRGSPIEPQEMDPVEEPNGVVVAWINALAISIAIAAAALARGMVFS
jgi:hypothetical protein